MDAYLSTYFLLLMAIDQWAHEETKAPVDIVSTLCWGPWEEDGQGWLCGEVGCDTSAEGLFVVSSVTIIAGHCDL